MLSRPQYYHTGKKTVIAISPKFAFFEGMRPEQGPEARARERERVFFEQRQEQRRIIAERVRVIKNLAYATLAGEFVPRGRARCSDLYHKGVPKLRELGQKGGPEYDRAVALLKYTWISPRNFHETEALLTA